VIVEVPVLHNHELLYSDFSLYDISSEEGAPMPFCSLQSVVEVPRVLAYPRLSGLPLLLPEQDYQ
jgi:hypothetical protein